MMASLTEQSYSSFLSSKSLSDNLILSWLSSCTMFALCFLLGDDLMHIELPFTGDEVPKAYGSASEVFSLLRRADPLLNYVSGIIVICMIFFFLFYWNTFLFYSYFLFYAFLGSIFRIRKLNKLIKKWI